jgi:hypothetical protein
MIRRLTYALGLSLALAAAGCKGADPVVGMPTAGGGGSESRKLAQMMPELKKSLTPTLSEQTFGPPDQKAGSGLIIYIYNVEDGKKVNLAFPGPTALISYAFVQEKSGGTNPLPLLD